MNKIVCAVPCDDDLIKLVIEDVTPIVEAMDIGEERKAKQLFEPELWNILSINTRKDIGKCLVCIVAKGLLPLENLGASPRTANHVVYRKI